MTKMDWVMLAAVAIPVVPAILKEVRLWWEAKQKQRRQISHKHTQQR